jgi:hypothetical protein
MGGKVKIACRRCSWCGLGVDVAPLLVDTAIVGWLCRRLHVRSRIRAPAAPRVLCALCGTRTGTLPDIVDGRRLVVCRECRDDDVAEPKEVTTRERLLRALVRSYGLDIAELAQLLGEDDEHGRARLSAILNRAVRDGLVQFTGGRMDRVYTVTDQGRVALR